MAKCTVTSTTNTTGAISKTTAIPGPARLKQITIHFNTAPSTSENFTATLDSILGPAFDTILYTVNPSSGSQKDIVFTPTNDDIILAEGDQIVVAFPNTDNRTYGVRIVTQAL